MYGIKVIRKGGYRRNANRLSFLLSALLFLVLRGVRYDIFHIYIDPDIAIFARVIGKLYGKKVVNESVLFGVDDPISIKKRKTGVARFYTFLLCDAYVSLASPITDSFRSAGIPTAKVYQIPPIVNSSEFKPVDNSQKLTLRRQLGLPEDKIIIISVGIVYRRKGFDILIDAFQMMKLKSKSNSIYLVIIGPTNVDDDGTVCNEGSSPFYSQLLNTIHSYGISQDVLFTGEIKDPDNYRQYLQASDIFAFPSRKEGLPSAVIEAMSVGLPCVVSHLDGVSDGDIFTGPDTGIIIKKEDPSLYAEAIAKFVNDSAYGTMCGRNARELAEKKFSVVKITEQYISLYSDLAAK